MAPRKRERCGAGGSWPTIPRMTDTGTTDTWLPDTLHWLPAAGRPEQLMVLLHGLLGNRCGGVVLRGECHGSVRLRQVDRLFVGAITARTWAS